MGRGASYEGVQVVAQGAAGADRTAVAAALDVAPFAVEVIGDPGAGAARRPARTGLVTTI